MADSEPSNALYRDRPILRPTARTYGLHLMLLGVTFCTATLAGILFPFGPINTFPADDPQTTAQFFEFIISLPARYVAFVVDSIIQLFTVPGYLAYGLSFSISLLFILMCHEMGHYLMCRRYRVDATLPFFIPTPPLIGPAGTFGAFIKIMSPMPSRKAVFDIGVAGPIVGFIALLPVTVIAFLTLKFRPLEAVKPEEISPIDFAQPLLFKLFAFVAGYDFSDAYVQNPFYFAAWVGLLVTALNLIPSGQLDGGHAIYAALGEKVHYWTGRIAFAVMATLSILGMYFYQSPSGFLIAVILGIMMRVRHPRPWDTTPLDAKRKVVAILTLIIFALCFVPFPIQIN